MLPLPQASCKLCSISLDSASSTAHPRRGRVRPTRLQFARMTLGQYLSLRRYGAAFRDLYVAPMCAAVWSVPNAQVGRCWAALPAHAYLLTK
jgi:predicted NAD/FAD-binding protein